MFRFQKDQEGFRIGGAEFGGQPGRRRTVMAGSVFYPGHSIVTDRLKGTIDQERYRQRMDRFLAATEETSAPAALVVYAETEEAMSSYLDIVADEGDMPIFLDSPSSEVKLTGVRQAAEMGLLDRVIYNSLNAGSRREEWQAIGDIGLRNAVLLAFNPKDLEVKGKIYLLEDGDDLIDDGLLEMADEFGIDRPLIDTAVMSIEQGAGSALRAMFVAKAKWGLPCGCALHNAVESWDLANKVKEEDPQLFRYIDVASAAIPIMSGADFVMFGPIEYGRRAMLVSTFADVLQQQAVADLWR